MSHSKGQPQQSGPRSAAEQRKNRLTVAAQIVNVAVSQSLSGRGRSKAKKYIYLWCECKQREVAKQQ